MQPSTQTSRNSPCPCGSGKKFKRCCGQQQAASRPQILTHSLFAPARELELAGRFGSACQRYSELLRQYKNHPALLWAQGRCLMELGQTTAAIKSLKLAARHYAGNEQLLVDVSSRLIIMGDPQGALTATEEGVRRYENNAQLLLNRADALRLLGDYSEAIELLDRVLALEPSRTGAIVSLVNCMRASGEVKDALSLAQSTLSNAKDKDLDYAGLLNEIAHCQQSLGDYGAAFESITISGRIANHCPEAHKSDSAAFLERIDCYHRWVSTHGMPATWQGEETRKKPVFMVGFPRSGTTLLESMLAAHPRVITSGEYPLIGHAITSLLPDVSAINRLPEIVDSASPQALGKARDAYWAAVRAQFGESYSWFVDKTPLNIIELPLIRSLFPEAKIVLSLRDPRDVCISSLFQHFAITPAMQPFLEWDSTVDYYTRIMGFWRTMEPLMEGSVIVQKYEDLVADFPGQIRPLAKFLEIPWDDKILSYVERNQNTYFNTPSNHAIKGHAHQAAVARWRNYPEAMTRAEAKLGSFVEAFGYQ